MELSIIIGLVASVLAGYFASLSMRRIERKREEKAPSLEDRVTSLTESLGNSLAVISEIEAEIKKRGEIATKLKGDIKRYEQLKELNQAQVEAITQTIKSEVGGESRRSIRRNAIITFAIAAGFFFLGRYIGAM